jgi:beta-glucanase (GH16 family)
MKLPRGQGLWPAFWLLGADFEAVGWPACGEIDILEYRGQEPNIVHGSLHGPGFSGGSAVTRSYTVPGVTLDTDFHVYAGEWTSTRITWFVDGHAYATVTSRDLPSGGRWVFDHPFFIILNLAVGGGFVGAPDSSTTFPQQVTVDYVRVYRPE